MLTATGVLDFWQAQEFVRNLRQTPKRGAYTVKDAVRDYLDRLEGRASWHDTKMRLEAFVLPAFGYKKVSELEADEIRKWHREIAKTPAETEPRPALNRLTAETICKNQRRNGSGKRLPIAVRGCVKAALNLAWREKKVGSNDAWQRVGLFRGVDIPRARYLNVSEAQRLINAARVISGCWCKRRYRLALAIKSWRDCGCPI